MPVDPAKLRLIHYPDARLRQKAQPVPVDPQRGASGEVRAVAARMIEIMHEARGVGLAAPQVGLAWRLFVVNPTGEPGDDRVLINPQLLDPGAETGEHEEGCLSIPGVSAMIRRPLRITVRAVDLDGRPVEMTSDALPARIWQHETDHLDGVLIIDRMTALDRMANRRSLAELEAQGG